MSSKRGRNRSSGAVSDRRSDDSKGSPESLESESNKLTEGIKFEYETEDGLKISLEPGSAEVSREFEVSESDFIELSAGIDWSAADMKIEKKGLDLDVSGSAELPGNMLGVSGGIVVDLGKGEIVGGELGVEFGGGEIEIGIEGEKGCKKTISISYAGIGIGYGRDDCEKNENTDDNESEEEIKKPSGNAKRLTPKELIDLVPKSDCGIVQFTVCYYLLIEFSNDGQTETIENMKAGIGMGYKAIDSALLFERFDGVVPDPQLGFRSQDMIWADFSGDFFNQRPANPKYYIRQNTRGFYSIDSNGILFVNYGSGSGRRLDFDSDDETDIEIEILKNSVVYWINDSISQCSIKDVRRSRNKPRIPPSSPPIKENPMNECCRESTKLMREIHQVLDCREMISKGVSTPNRWIAAGAKKSSTSNSYLELMVFQMRMLDHLGIHPFTAEVTDVNAAQEGNQSVSIEFANATAAVKQITELLLENKGDSSTRLNLMIRTAVAVGQILNVVSIISKTIEGIVQYLGMPIRERVFKVKMPFDFTFGARNGSTKGKGFGKGTQGGVNNLDVNTEEATEALLPKFMQDSEQPIVVEDYDDRQDDLTDIIRGK